MRRRLTLFIPFPLEKQGREQVCSQSKLWESGYANKSMYNSPESEGVVIGLAFLLSSCLMGICESQRGY
jgi:hypothetical protein